MTRQSLKVLFLTRYPGEGASSRYRVYQYIPFLEAMQVTCTVQSFMDSAMYRTYFSSGKSLRKLWLMLKATLGRVTALLQFRTYDIIYMQRELFPFAPPLLERYMKRQGAILLFDYDDAIFINKPNRYNPIAGYLKSSNKIEELFRLVDCVVAGNEWLRDRAQSLGARAVTLEVAEDTDRIAMHAPHNNAQPVTIGWLGSTSTVKYLRLIEPVLQRLAMEHPDVQFEAMGGGDFQMDGVNWHISTWSLDDELKALARFDIGLMPLPDEDWSKGKCGGKARTYMAAGVVPVCAGIGYNLDLIRHGETGYLCTTEQEWYRALKILIEDCELRQRIAVAARTDVVARFSLSRQAAALRGIFDNVLSAHVPRTSHRRI